MCAQCDELIRKIARYKRFVNEGLDPLTLQRIKELIAELQKRLAEMHQHS